MATKTLDELQARISKLIEKDPNLVDEIQDSGYELCDEDVLAVAEIFAKYQDFDDISVFIEFGLECLRKREDC